MHFWALVLVVLTSTQWELYCLSVSRSVLLPRMEKQKPHIYFLEHLSVVCRHSLRFFSPLQVSETEYYELKMKIDFLILLSLRWWGLGPEPLAREGVVTREFYPSSFSIPRAREMGRGGHKRLYGGVGG